ncbi:DUF563 domain-containing protein [Microcoleus sp. FACHB-1515]|uniref:glycosyltransferase 61 family protein n=1 Tax=Cyanophyceae TaxID=3028117 RepID=UPI0016897CFA|nr:glycosyltransferase 61 family protein [Microcoleus sp. FACHB-1515]MBD2092350.1 DUF563 domain-containing protein [Microcoleus sp. FACHB-1515]
MDAEQWLTAAEYEAAIAQDPTNLRNYWQLGLVLLRSGEAELAQMVWMSGLAEAQPADFADLIALLEAAADRAFAAQKFAEAALISEQILHLDGDRAEIYHRLAQALAQQGEYDAAIEMWQQALAKLSQGTALQPDLVDAYIELADILQKFEDWQGAIEAYTAALALAPSAELAVQLGRCQLQIGEIEEAIAHFQQAAQLQPNWAVPYAEWGYALLQKNCLTEARLQFQNAIDLLPPTELIERLDRSFANLQSPPAANSSKAIDLSVAPPLGFHESSAAFSEAIEPASVVKLKPPKSIDFSIHFSFRFGESIELPGMFVAAIPNGRFWISEDETSCVCIAADNRFLPELSPEFPIFSPGHPDNHPSRHSILKSAGLPPVEKIGGSIAILSSLQNHLYFHWMFEVLPRWNLLQRSGINLDSIDYFVIPNNRSFQQESIEKLEIPQSKILDLKFHIQADRLIVPFPGCIAWMNRSTCDFLRSTFLPANPTPEKRLYISRSQTTNRRVTNEAEILELLTPYGFESVTLEALSVSEQAALFASATVVVAPHGSGLTNLVFCRSKTIVIELFSPNFVYPCYWFLSNLVELDYYYLLGEMPLGASVQRWLFPDARIEDISIDPRKLIKLMQIAGVI